MSMKYDLNLNNFDNLNHNYNVQNSSAASEIASDKLSRYLL